MKIAFTSDLHIDVNSLEYEVLDVMVDTLNDLSIDKLFVAGDTFNNYNKTISFFNHLNSLVETEVYFIFGNHEYWTNNLTYEKSLEDLSPWYFHNKIINITDDVVMIGSNGWFDLSFVQSVYNDFTKVLPHDDYTLYSIGRQSFDLGRVQIGNQHKDIFKKMYNETQDLLEKTKGKQVLFATHFLPHEDFLTYRNNLWNTCNAFMGSKHIHELLKEYNVTDCTFGHTHTRFGTKQIDNINYHANPIGYRDYDNSWTTNDFKKEFTQSLTILEFD